MQNEALNNFLYKTQINRKIDFSKFIFYNKNIIAIIITCFISYQYGEQAFIFSSIGLIAYLYNNYKKTYLLYNAKISKSSGSYYYFISKTIKEIYKKNNALVSERIFADIFLNGYKKNTKGNKK